MVWPLPTVALVWCYLVCPPITHDYVVERVDLVEHNIVMHEYEGKLVPGFEQVIFWRWFQTTPGTEPIWYVVGWRRPSDLEWQGRTYTGDRSFIFYDGRIIRDIRTRHVKETVTDFDPEVEERKTELGQRRQGFIRERFRYAPDAGGN